jgi:hypothetical protein
MPGGTLTRRDAFIGAASIAAGVATGAPAAAIAHGDGHHGDRRVPEMPKPIPGGSPIGPPLGTIHVFAPGPEGVVLPFTGVPLEGLDVEPTTITDFNGFAALAFHVGSARGSDGVIYDLETDLRAYQGTYVDRNGKRRFGTFGFF